MKRLTDTAVKLTAAALAVAWFGLGCKNQQPAATATAPPPSPVVETAPDDSWVSISGDVVETSPDSFILDYGTGTITVEMDDWDFYPEGYALLENDDVIVYGYIDDGFYERRTIEASSVYVQDLGTQFYASGVDEEDFSVVPIISVEPQFEVSGTVEAVSGDEFQLDTGAGIIDVNTEGMPYDPLDDEGFQQIRAGDRVRVTGELGQELFNDLDLMADTVVTLQHDAT